jgi:hypothetical protein
MQVSRYIDMPEEERQEALPNAAEADDENAAGELYVDLVLGHDPHRLPDQRRQ